MNDRLGADFDARAFEHVAFYDEKLRLDRDARPVAREQQVADVPGADVTLRFDEGDELRTEISCKYTRESLERASRAPGCRSTRGSWTRSGSSGSRCCADRSPKRRAAGPC